MALRTPTIPWFALLWDFRVKIMLAELRTPQQFLCSMYLKSGKAILREQKLFFFPVKKPHSEEISSGAILGTNLSFTKGGGGSVSFVQDQVTSWGQICLYSPWRKSACVRPPPVMVLELPPMHCNIARFSNRGKSCWDTSNSNHSGCKFMKQLFWAIPTK